MRSLTDKDYDVLPNHPISNSRIRVSHAPTLQRRTLSQQGKDGRHPYLVLVGCLCGVGKIVLGARKENNGGCANAAAGASTSRRSPEIPPPDLSAALRQDGKCLIQGPPRSPSFLYNGWRLPRSSHLRVSSTQRKFNESIHNSLRSFIASSVKSYSAWRHSREQKLMFLRFLPMFATTA
jgi:hypothetical protein